MPIPTWSVGQVLAASDVNSWFVSLYALKPSDQTLTSNTTLTNDTALFLNLAANATYEFKLRLQIVANATARFNSQFTGPAGASMAAGIMGLNAGASYGATTRGLASAVVFDGNAAAVVPLWWDGNVTTTATSGTFQFQWAQSVSNGTGCVVKAGSSLQAFRVA